MPVKGNNRTKDWSIPKGKKQLLTPYRTPTGNEKSTYTPHLHLFHIRCLALSDRFLFITKTLKNKCEIISMRWFHLDKKKQPKITAYRLIQYLSQVFLLLNLLSKLIPKNKRKEKKSELKEILTTVKRLINYNFFLSESLNANPLKTHDNEYR